MLTLIIAVVAFVVILSTLILVHEWGHFITARMFGVKVEEFGLGLPPQAKVLKKDKKGTVYSLNWLPLGGFVKMKGEDSHDRRVLAAKDSFGSKPVWQRMIIICAGVAMNVVLCVVALTIVSLFDHTVLIPPDKIAEFVDKNPTTHIVHTGTTGLLVSKAIEDGPAAAADIRPNDFIVGIDDQKITTADAFKAELATHTDMPVTLQIRRNTDMLTAAVQPDGDGHIQVLMSEPYEELRVSYPLAVAPVEAVKQTYGLAGVIIHFAGGFFYDLAHGHIGDNVGGPIKIAEQVYYLSGTPSVDLLVRYLNMTALLSLTLAVFNILPIPALDGGRLVFLIAEVIIRRRPSPWLEARVHIAGYVFLMGLILIISVHDIFGG